MKKLLLILLCLPMIGFGQCVRGDCENGYGTTNFANEDKYIGEYKDDKRHGQGTFTWANGGKYVGKYKDGKQHGKGTFTYGKGEYEGSKYTGEWLDDKMHGQGTYTFADGEKYIGEYKDGKRHGQGTYTWANGGKYVGEWLDAKKHGQGTYTWANGKKYVGEWLDAKEHGQGTVTYADGSKYIGEFIDGRRIDWPSSFKKESVVRDFLDSKINLDNNEGIYRYQNNDPSVASQYKFLILKDGYKYNGYLMDALCAGCQDWEIGDVKFVMSEGAVKGLFDVEWKRLKRNNHQFIFFSELDGGLITNKNNLSLIKLYPKLGEKNNGVKNVVWAGNGSGIIISKSGYIVTNHHVIDNADDIEVEFVLDDEVQKFNAEIIQSDKVNDLAVIKIVDVNFNGVKELPYNFKTRSSDVGTKVYAFGYPMALTIMGKEIKVTDGIISSKTGYDGDVTTYQISAPIQGGNSGGPLFDDKGNFIGINSSGLIKQLADNVGYSIKTSYVLNLIDILPKTIDLPSNKNLASLPLT